MTDENKNPTDALPSQSTGSPFGKISEQIHVLDSALSTIKGFTEESSNTRIFIIGQIEALHWAMKQFDVD